MSENLSKPAESESTYRVPLRYSQANPPLSEAGRSTDCKPAAALPQANSSHGAPLSVCEHGIEQTAGSPQLPSSEPHESHERVQSAFGAELFELGLAQLQLIREQIANGR